MFNCSCCGTEVTSPYFFSGGVYGYTCIKKVNPNAKKNKPKSKCVEVEVLKIVWRTPDSAADGYGQAIVNVNGQKSRVRVLKELNDTCTAYTDNIHIADFQNLNGKWYTFV